MPALLPALPRSTAWAKTEHLKSVERQFVWDWLKPHYHFHFVHSPCH